jgi:hypothetical protein
MTVQAFNVRDELRRIVNEGRISEGSLQTITGISLNALASFIATTQDPAAGMIEPNSTFSDRDEARLSALTAQLTEGFDVDDDERLQAILETLTAQWDLTPQNIALLTRVDVAALEAFLTAPASVSADTKYEISVRAFYLLNAIGNASPPSAQG